VISQHSLLQSVCQHFKHYATRNPIPVVTTGWCAAVVHQNCVRYWHGNGEVCVAIRTKPFNDIGSTVVSAELWSISTYEKSIYKWHKSFAKTGFVCAKNKNSRTRLIDDDEERVPASFLRSPQKSTRRAMSLTWQRGECYVSDCLSGRTNF
jgi:hypothetical protein